MPSWWSCTTGRLSAHLVELSGISFCSTHRQMCSRSTRHWHSSCSCSHRHARLVIPSAHVPLKSLHVPPRVPAHHLQSTTATTPRCLQPTRTPSMHNALVLPSAPNMHLQFEADRGWVWTAAGWWLRSPSLESLACSPAGSFHFRRRWRDMCAHFQWPCLLCCSRSEAQVTRTLVGRSHWDGIGMGAHHSLCLRYTPAFSVRESQTPFRWSRSSDSQTGTARCLHQAGKRYLHRQLPAHSLPCHRHCRCGL